MKRLGTWFMLVNLVLWPLAAHAYKITAPVNSCIANMKRIDGAAREWALEHKASESAVYSLSDPELLNCLKGSVLPACPSGGRYVSWRRLNESPLCTVHGTLDSPRQPAGDMYIFQQSWKPLINGSILFGCSALAFVLFITSPLSPLLKKLRKPLFFASLALITAATVVFVFLFSGIPGFLHEGGWIPSLIFTGFCILAGIVLGLREVGWRSNFGYFCAGVGILMNAITQMIALLK